MKKSAFTIIALVCLFLGNAFATVREEFHQTYPISATGKIALENVNGDVTITAWDKNEVRIDAVKEADDESKLSEMKIVVDSDNTSIKIKTDYVKKWNNKNAGTVTYKLSVPRNAELDKIDVVNGDLEITDVKGSVDGSSVNGKVQVRGLMGDADLNSVNGPVEAIFDGLGKSISVESVNGSVTVSLPSNASATIDAETLNGRISNDFGIEMKKGKYVGSHLNGEIGSGATEIDIDTVNGSIEIVRH